jgi:predicted peptidase
MFSCTNQHTASKIETTDSEDELLKIPFVTSLDNTEKDFFLYLPRGYRDHPEKSWPVLMFLHGDGDRGNSKEEMGFVLKQGPLY